MPRFKLTISKEFTIDLDDDDEGLTDALSAIEVDEGVMPDKDDLHDAMRQMLETDLESVVDLSEINETDITIEVLK